MKLENQVVSLELSKKLKELVKQESLWWWVKVAEHYSEKENFDLLDTHTKDAFLKGYGNDVIYCSAFTVAELGEMLKDKDEYKYFLWGYHLPKRDCFDLILETSDRTKILWEVRAITEANARAKMLIYLKENKL